MTTTDRARPSDALFAGPGVEWRRISPRWRTVHWLSSAIAALVLGVPLAAVVHLLFGSWGLTAIPVAVVAALWLWNAWLVARRWPAWGYAETPDELWVRHGVLYRSLTVVPYGRLQVVDVSSGPLLRAFGLANVTLVTASAATDAHIPGLPYEEAVRLRDQLTARGDAQGSGL